MLRGNTIFFRLSDVRDSACTYTVQVVFATCKHLRRLPKNFIVGKLSRKAVYQVVIFVSEIYHFFVCQKSVKQVKIIKIL